MLPGADHPGIFKKLASNLVVILGMSTALMHTGNVSCHQSCVRCISALQQNPQSSFCISSSQGRTDKQDVITGAGICSGKQWYQPHLFISRRKMTLGLYTVDVSLLQFSNEIAALARHPVHRAAQLIFWVLCRAAVLCTGTVPTGLPCIWKSPTNTGHPPNLDNIPEPNRNKDRSSTIQTCCSLFSETTKAKIYMTIFY